MKFTPVERFIGLLKHYKVELRQIYAFAIFSGIVNLTLPVGIQAIINYIQTGEITYSWIVLVIFVLLGIAISGFLQIFQLRVVENIQQDIFTKAAFEFSFRLPKIKLSALDNYHTPELANRFFDTLTIQKGMPKILIDFSLAAFQIVFGLLLLAIYSPYFIILALVLVVILGIIFQFTGPQGLSTSLKESKSKYKLAFWIEEVARLNKSFKIYANDNFHLDQTDEIVVDYLSHRENHFQVILSQFRFFIAFKVIVAAGLLILGGLLVFDERMNIGQFVAAEIIIILIINSVEKILRTIESIYDVLTGLEKMGYVTDFDLDKNVGKADLKDVDQVSIEAKNIYFKFKNDKKPIFKDLSFKIEEGSKTLIAGPSGSGKTLLLRILSGIQEIKEGGLYLNQIEYGNYNRDSIYKNIGVSFPTNELFQGTFYDNIAIGRKVDESELGKIIEILHLDEYLDKQPKGLNSIIDSVGRRMPRAVIQKILLARILIGKPKVLLLEEPLQFVQEEEKLSIIEYIMDKNKPWTVLVVGDFPFWRRKADYVLELKID